MSNRKFFRAPARAAFLAAAALALSLGANAAPDTARLVHRVDPEFPREALQTGTNKGIVKARMTLDGHGAVTQVEILEATPRRMFDRAVMRSLSQWKFEDGAPGRSVETEVVFNR